MQTSVIERLYHIKNDANYFYAGRIKNGKQVLMGIQAPEIIVIEFDEEGNCSNTILRIISKELLPTQQSISVSETDELTTKLHVWQNELGFVPGTISVKIFFLTDRWIGIRDLPDHYQNVLDRPEDYSDDRRRDLLEDIRQWKKQGDFVLYWDEEYYLNRRGEVDSS